MQVAQVQPLLARTNKAGGWHTARLASHLSRPGRPGARSGVRIGTAHSPKMYISGLTTTEIGVTREFHFGIALA